MDDQRLPARIRLKKRSDFLRVQRRGRRLSTRHLLVRWSSGPDPDGERYGLTVSRKVGNAVTRNRVKRWLREAIRRNKGHVAGCDVVLIARRSAAEAGQARLLDEVAGAVRRIARQEAR